MVQSTVFKNNQTQAVRFPKAVALPEHVKKVHIIKEGNSRVVIPHDELWDTWFDGPTVTADFMETRDQPIDQERDSFT